MLMLELDNFLAAFAEWQVQAVPMLAKARAAVDCWALDDFDYRQLKRGLQKSYRKARRLLAVANADPTAENFHAFRMKAKTLWYQLRVLRPVNPIVLDSLIGDLRSLGDLLGRAHDLSFLGERLRSEHGRSEWQREARELLMIIDSSQRELQRDAVELAEHFFAERPRDFGRRVANWLDDWADAAAPSLAQTLAT
jgi:CHAD domain-containing protein